MDRYTGFAPCPFCFESSGHPARYIPATWWEPAWEDVDYSRNCPECEGTGMVECDEPRTLDDLESEEWDADTAAWVASIGELVSGRAVA